MASVLTPTDERQLLEVVTMMAAHKTPVEIVGGSTKRALGRPVEAEHKIALNRLAGIELYEPEELVLSAGAGTKLVHIEAALATHRQMLAFEPIDYGPLLGSTPGEDTIGGVLACNLSGPRRIKAGAARDHFLGVHGVSGRAAAFKSGGRVVKNVTGYDLCKLMAGSFGTLAVMSRVTVKVLPAPETVHTLLIHGLDDAAAIAALTRAMQSPHEVSGAAHLPAPVADALGMPSIGHAREALTAVRVEGFAPSVAARTAALAELFGGLGELSELDSVPSATFWREVRDALPLARLPSEYSVWRLSVPPARGAAVAAAVRAAVPALVFYDWVGGLVWAAVEPCPDAGQAAIRAAVAASGGHATLVRASPAQRAALDPFQPLERGAAALTRRVKESFDPYRILNRGRMYPDA